MINKTKIFNLLGTLFIYFYISQDINAQQVQEIIRLDTIISTLQVDSGMMKPAVASNKSSLWVYFPSMNDNDSLLFLRLNLKTYKMDTFWLVIPSISSKISNPEARSFSINDKYLVLLFFKSFVTFEIKPNKKPLYLGITPLQESAEYIHLLEEQIIFGRCYNHHPLDEVIKTQLSIYDIKTEKFKRVLTPEFSNIEFSHFAPNHWMDATENKILFAQTTEYQIDIYNSSLKKIGNIERQVSNWNNFDSSIAIRLRRELKPGQAKKVIEILSPVEDTISRLESAYFINDSTIFIRHIPPFNKKQKRIRLIDIWQLNQNNQWTLIAKDFRDEKPTVETIFSKNNYPLLSVYYNIGFIDQKLYFVKPSAKINEFGKSYSAIIKEEDEYFIKQNPEFNIYIYSIKKISGNKKE